MSDSSLNWLEFIVALGVSQVVLLAVLAFLARSVIVHWLGKDLEKFKADLNSGAALALERFKAQLERDAREHEVRFADLHARRAEAIATVHASLVGARRTMRSLVNTWSADNRDDFSEAWEEFRELRHLFALNRIYLPEALCTQLDECVRLMWRPTVLAGVWASTPTRVDRERAEEAFTEAFEAVDEGGVVDAAVMAIEAEFRRVLGDPSGLIEPPRPSP